MTDHCLMINALCPSDLCLLPRDHPGTSRNEHLLGTMYGSADPDVGGGPNPKYRERMSKKYMPLAPEGSSIDDLYQLGSELSDRLWGDRR